MQQPAISVPYFSFSAPVGRAALVNYGNLTFLPNESSNLEKPESNSNDVNVVQK